MASMEGSSSLSRVRARVKMEGGGALSSFVRFTVSGAGVSGEATEKEELALVSGPRPRSMDVSQTEPKGEESRRGGTESGERVLVALALEADDGGRLHRRRRRRHRRGTPKTR
jgi:hypothetical protein